MRKSVLFYCFWKGPGAPQAKLQDLGTGEYLVSFALPSKGAYKVSCKLNGQNVQGSPFSLQN
jgi:hypothetical protein